jgi:hypothetical protein
MNLESKRNKLERLLSEIGFSLRSHGAGYYYIYTDEEVC